MQVTNCLICGSPTTLFCDLGSQYPANALDNSESYPLAVEYCKKCYHTQLNYIVDRKLLFDNYTYISGVSQHLRDFWKDLKRFILSHSFCAGREILDIAANDGSFLEEWKDWDRVGVEPCGKISSLCNDEKIEFINDYFPGCSSKLAPRSFDIITAFNVLAHVPNPVQFLFACKELLKDTGSLWIMTSQADMIEKAQFDTIYHEHISYFSAKSFRELAKQIGMSIEICSKANIHGGSYILQLRKSNITKPLSIELSEANTGRYTPAPYKSFNAKKNLTISRIRDFCEKFDCIVGLGASAKGSVVMQAADIRPTVVFDENPNKIGHVFPIGVPITKHALPFYNRNWGVINFTWNFFDELWNKLKQQIDTQTIFGEILHYFPEYRIDKF